MRDFRKAGVIFFTSVTLAAIGVGLHQAVHSSLFLVQVVEVDTELDADPKPSGVAAVPAQAAPSPQSQDPAISLTRELPVEPQVISDLAAIPVGRVNLFKLDLQEVEDRILTNPWIRSVRLQKRFPQTLSISVAFRKPQALIQSSGGVLSYVDQDGKFFGKVNLALQADLPVLSISAPESTAPTKVAGALEILRRWEDLPIGKLAQISSLSWDSERGYRVVASYLHRVPSGRSSPQVASGLGIRSRVLIDLGDLGDVAHSGSQSVDTELVPQFSRLAEVVRYLQSHSISARQIWADAGKKIIVKTARGS